MAKKHILTIGYQGYAFDSIRQATEVLRMLEKAIPCKYDYDAGDGRTYKPDDERRRDVELKINQEFKIPRPKADPKPLALPKPKRGTILCICEKSYVAPRETCAHCGRDFSESHNRTHGGDKQPHLRLL